MIWIVANANGVSIELERAGQNVVCKATVSGKLFTTELPLDEFLTGLDLMPAQVIEVGDGFDARGEVSIP